MEKWNSLTPEEKKEAKKAAKKAWKNLDDDQKERVKKAVKEVKGDDKGEGKKKFYEDPTLHEDEQKMNEVLEEKRRVEDMLQPASVDLGSQAAGSASNL